MFELSVVDFELLNHFLSILVLNLVSLTLVLTILQPVKLCLELIILLFHGLDLLRSLRSQLPQLRLQALDLIFLVVLHPLYLLLALLDHDFHFGDPFLELV